MSYKICNTLNELEEIQSSKKPDEEIYIKVQTVYNEFFEVEINYFSNYPEDKEIQICNHSLSYESIDSISYHSIPLDQD